MPEAEQLIRWVSSFDYPHCNECQSLSDLKSGIAICQIVYELILNKNTPKFLSQIIISNVNSDNSMSNLSHALDYICRCTQPPQEITELRPEQLYYDTKSLVKMLQYLYKLYLEGRSSLNPRLSDISQMPRRPPLPRQSLKSRPHNPDCPETTSGKRQQDTTERLDAQSMISLDKDAWMSTTNSQRMSRSQTRKKKIQEQSPIKNNINDVVDYSTKVLLCQWLSDIQLIKSFEGIEQKLASVCRNGMIFIDLVNWLNGKQVVLSQGAKFYNQFQTIQATFRKVLTFLSQFERMNPRYLLSWSQLAQGRNDDLFWGLLDDIYHLHHNKISKYDRRYWKLSSNKKILNTTTRFEQDNNRVTIIEDQKTQRPYKETLEKHRVSTKALTTQSSQARFIKQNKQNDKSGQELVISAAQKEQVYDWIRQHGLSYSLSKSLKSNQEGSYLQDPLRNGNILASLIMRLQIGKVNVIKDPTEDKHVKHNFRQINLNCARRTLNLGSLNPPFTKQTILKFILKLKNAGVPNKPASRQVPDLSKIREIPLCVKQWLDNMGITDIRNEFTKIATSVIKVDICRETTPKIQQNNISKILNYLKKLGLVQCLSVTYEDILDEQRDVVWDIVEDIYNLKFN